MKVARSKYFIFNQDQIIIISELFFWKSQGHVNIQIQSCSKWKGMREDVFWKIVEVFHPIILFTYTHQIHLLLNEKRIK